MNPLSLLPMRVWVELAGGALALGLFAGFVHHERTVGAAKVQHVIEAERQAASAAATAETARDQQARKDVSDEAERMLAHLASARAAAPAVDGRLLDAARAAGRREAAAAALRGASAADAGLVPAELYRSALAEARRLGDLADKRGIAGSACERYGSEVTQ